MYHYVVDTTYLLLYVDDTIMITSSTTLLQSITAQLNNEFDMTNLGALSYFLSISATRSSHGLFFSQRKYVFEILKSAHMLQCNPARTPTETTHKLDATGPPVAEPSLYRNLTGTLQYPIFT